jgi:superfamily II DNA or RNA helicase
MVLNTYLGNKGYTILKKGLSVEREKQIRTDLTIQPHVHGIGNYDGKTSYPAYRESNNKMYVPLYYGLSNFGIPETNKISDGVSINLEFAGSLRENQTPVVDAFFTAIKNPEITGGLLELPCAYGKTVLALNIISKLKKKTLIIVHKEFLLNQWVERIQQFLPNARIGKIQGQIIDIDNKDIVLGMLQSLSMKEYSSDLFSSFGLTIIDEVHHISSEVFSNSLFKIVTKYSLGLSATMERKDGTTKVFKMFLGDVIYKGKRDECHNVTVRALEYVVNDDEFNETKLDFRGNPMYSSMISKLCEYNRRSEFILHVLTNLLSENENQQIMILAHNKNLLKYLYDAISFRNIATVGYYIGGMKEAALKVSETKKVVIATYAMAAEALDIKTLTTLIMATPKTDIEQSVGRILRERHSNPIVIDIVDSHTIFKKQWCKRRAFYKRENYKILYAKSDEYMENKWSVVYEPKGIKADCKIKKNSQVKLPNKNKSSKSNSSSDKSITSDSEEEVDDTSPLTEEPADKLLCGKCFLKTKHI